MSFQHDSYNIIRMLWRHTKEHGWPKIYTILDTARDNDIFAKLEVSDIEKACLYEGEQAIELADVAPYLVKLRQGDTFTHWLLSEGWGKSWGIFIESSANLDELREHFQNFITVYDEYDNSFLFRYYDPRVLQVYLPTCNETELQILFGPVRHYYVETEDGSSMTEYSYVYGQLVQHAVQLAKINQ